MNDRKLTGLYHVHTAAYNKPQNSIKIRTRQFSTFNTWTALPLQHKPDKERISSNKDMQWSMYNMTGSRNSQQAQIIAGRAELIIHLFSFRPTNLFLHVHNCKAASGENMSSRPISIQEYLNTPRIANDDH